MLQPDTRVVVVDDSTDARDSLMALLELSGYTVRGAANGAEAIELCDDFAPHCVLLDVGLPGGIDGLALARFLRRRHGDGTVLIAVTGRDPNDAAVEAAFGAVDHWFLKPVQPQQLEKVLPAMH